MIARLRDRLNKHYKFFSKHYYSAYTLLFILMCVLVFMPFISANKTFVCEYDGFRQHYKALMYYGQWLRSIARSLLFDHKLVIPMWNFSLGQGSDVITTLHYYAVGDPLNILSIFVSSKYTYYLYDALILLRIYLSGLFFSMFCYKMKNTSKIAVMAGALSYAFCGFVIMYIRHPYFLNPMVYLPLLLIGVERVFEHKRAFLLTVSVCIAAMSNFYFFYMLGLLTGIYALGRLISMNGKKLKAYFLPIVKLLGYVLLGVLLSAVILIPVFFSFLNDGRGAAEYNFRWFYSFAYYTSLPADFIASYNIDSEAWTYMGYSAIVLPSVIMLFKKRHSNTLLKVFFSLGTICLLLPITGRIFNGFSYPANRWGFGYSFLVAYILTAMFPYIAKLRDKKNIMSLIFFIGAYSVLCFALENSSYKGLFISVALILAVLIYLLYHADAKAFKQRRAKGFILIVTLISICINSFFTYSVNEFKYVLSFKDKSELQYDINDTQDNAVKHLVSQNSSNDFYRYSGRNFELNSSLIKKTYNCQYYWSLGNVNVFNFRNEMNTSECLSQRYDGVDDRTALNALASVRYYVIPQNDKKMLPYGYRYINTKNVNEQKVEDITENLKKEFGTDTLSDEITQRIDSQYAKNYCVYENQFALPLGYTYDGYISKNDYEKMSAVEKQEAMLQGMVLKEEQRGFKQISPEITSEKVSYQMKCNSKDIIKQDNKFVVTKANSTVTLTFDGLTDSETYFSIKNISYKGSSKYELYNDDTTIDPLNRYTAADWKMLDDESRNEIKHDDKFWQESANLEFCLAATDTKNKPSVKHLRYYTPNYTWYNNRKDFAINFGYKQDAVKSITVTFPQIGVYSFDEISVICQPMNNYEKQINALKTDTLKNVSVDNNTVTGTIELDKPKLLCLSIPYSNGWTAYVDGNKQEILQANTMYIGLALDSGKHDVKLVYATPDLKLGACITYVTLTGIVIMSFVLFVYKKMVAGKPKKGRFEKSS